MIGLGFRAQRLANDLFKSGWPGAADAQRRRRRWANRRSRNR